MEMKKDARGGSGVDNDITLCALGLTAALLRKAQGANWLWPVAQMGISDPLWQKQGGLVNPEPGSWEHTGTN